jgi:hypothetical protein
MLGLIGCPPVCASEIAVQLGVLQLGGLEQSIASIPEFFWELALGVYLAAKGFGPLAAASEPTRTATTQLVPAA